MIALHGTIQAPPSKSEAIRLLLASALSNENVTVSCGAFCEDVSALCDCLRSLGWKVTEIAQKITLSPDGSFSGKLFPKNSAAVYRFLVPVCAALGKNVTFYPEEQLKNRPMEALFEALSAHGITICDSDGVSLSGQLLPGDYTLPGDISSQYASGLLFALPLLNGNSRLAFTSPLQSSGYLDLTVSVLARFGIKIRKTETGYFIPGNQRFHAVDSLSPEGDWSSASCLLCAALCCGDLKITGLKSNSLQPDSVLFDLLPLTVDNCAVCAKTAKLSPLTLDVSHCPDLVPALAIIAAGATGTSVFTGAGRLRYKESDRLSSIASVINSLGGCARIEDSSLMIEGTGKLLGGTVDPRGDHRIAMMAQCLQVISENPVKVTDLDCIGKSYPNFLRDFNSLLEETK